MKYLEGLNERQRAAAEHLGGPLMIIAGAGAGKTKTITHRIAHMIEGGVPARAILAVTFTNKAAGEMRERVRLLLGPGAGAPGGLPGGIPTICTFHSLGVRLLREFCEDAGLPRHFSIWDRDDSIRAIKSALEKLSIDAPPRAILSVISRGKGDGVSEGEYARRALSDREQRVSRTWKLYDKALSDEGALDFDDLLSRTLSLLRTSERVRTLLQKRWSHITIDEYQDTNAAQYEIARILAGENMNICVVGDIDQNIYSWRGADIEHLLSFEQSFPGTKTVVLEQNYRSTRTILSAANGIIEKNQRRKPKVLFTDRGTGDPIVIFNAQNEIDEAWFVAGRAEELIAQGTHADEIAVLYRENFQSRALEEAMLAFGVPYRVLGVRFFDRKEVKDTLSYLRAALNPISRVDIARIVGVPPRGIGKVTLDKMLLGLEGDLSGAARVRVAAFRDTLARIRKAVLTLPCSEAIRYVAEESGMEKMYSTDDSSNALGASGRERLDNIRELVNYATRFDYDTPRDGMEKLLEEAALQSDQDTLPAKGEGAEAAVSLMTVHASKGLEFDAVFITGLEQGLFPWVTHDENRDEEEERRLFYVALTRARERLFLTHARERMRWGSREYALPSEFLSDIDQRLVVKTDRARPKKEDEEIISY
ncbi:MAG TPA: UvrD-helicase domain-containing protein [Candidatus Paceibacterota bacterium]